MKLSTEFKYGILIFLGIGIYFLLMEVLGLSQLYFLRILNVFIVIYGLNLAIKSNLKNGKVGYLPNLTSSALTGFIGIGLGIIGLVAYLKIRGGEQYMNQLSEAFLFGGEPSIAEYSFGLFIEGIASVLIVAFINMQYWRTKDVFKDDVEVSL
ncbi:hypothetical protein [Flavobacterium sp.]|jgi:hypothetical protein|uniref:hypothetical protein n=1 Tax=Flavobacterium sp. TaxID=239 RepID=UPI000EE6C4EF|nr:hypothetical protein [Flavobacterium sp.]HCQ13390.1 hypothetical protein [Flavobacterium sp.]